MEATRAWYQQNDFSMDKGANEKVVKVLGEEGREFFEKIGVYYMKILAEEKYWYFCEDDNNVRMNKLTLLIIWDRALF